LWKSLLTILSSLELSCGVVRHKRDTRIKTVNRAINNVNIRFYLSLKAYNTKPGKANGYYKIVGIRERPLAK